MTTRTLPHWQASSRRVGTVVGGGEGMFETDQQKPSAHSINLITHVNFISRPFITRPDGPPVSSLSSVRPESLETCHCIQTLLVGSFDPIAGCGWWFEIGTTLPAFRDRPFPPFPAALQIPRIDATLKLHTSLLMGATLISFSTPRRTCKLDSGT